MFEVVLLSGFLGLIVGSFINAWVWRIREEKSVARGRSMCPQCEHTLDFWDLIPVLSWIFLKGKCKYCQANISTQYPIVEIITTIAFTLSAIWWPFPSIEPLGWVLFVLWLGITALFIALSVYDFKWYLLPSVLLGKLLIFVIIWQIVFALYGADVWEWLFSPLLGAAVAFGFFYTLHVIGRGKWMGGGDVKLVFVLGLTVGLTGTLVGLFISFVMGAVIGLLLIAAQRKGRGDMVPFGPFLLLGFWIAFFFSYELIEWYTQLIVGV